MGIENDVRVLQDTVRALVLLLPDETFIKLINSDVLDNSVTADLVKSKLGAVDSTCRFYVDSDLAVGSDYSCWDGEPLPVAIIDEVDRLRALGMSRICIADERY